MKQKNFQAQNISGNGNGKLTGQERKALVRDLLAFYKYSELVDMGPKYNGRSHIKSQATELAKMYPLLENPIAVKKEITAHFNLKTMRDAAIGIAVSVTSFNLAVAASLPESAVFYAIAAAGLAYILVKTGFNESKSANAEWSHGILMKHTTPESKGQA